MASKTAKSAKRDAALLALLEGKSQAEAAKQAAVSDRTIRRWLADPSFAHDLERLRRARFARTLDRFAACGEEAVEVLRGIAQDPEKPASARVAAARALLAPVLQPVSPDQVTSRLAYMRGAAGETQKQKKLNHKELMRGLLSELGS